MQEFQYLGPQLRVAEPEPKGCSHQIAYVLDAMISILYDLLIFIYGISMFPSSDIKTTLMVLVVMILAVHGIVMHFMGIITVFMSRSSAPCMISFAKVSYLVHFIIGVVLLGFVVILFCLAKEQQMKALLFFVALFLGLGVTLVTIAWSIYCFDIYPGLPVHTFSYTPSYQPLFCLPLAYPIFSPSSVDVCAL